MSFRLLTLFLAVALMACGSVFATDTSDSSAPFIGIPDDGFDGTLGSMASDTITVTGHGAGETVTEVSVDLALTHTWVGDLTIALEAPNGQVLGLASRPGLAEIGDGSDCCGTDGDWFGLEASFSDAGLTSAEDMADVFGGESFFAFPDTTKVFLGSGPDFAAFNGQAANGDWTLYVGDSAALDTGTFDSWTINISSVPEPASFGLLGIAGMMLLGMRRRN